VAARSRVTGRTSTRQSAVSGTRRAALPTAAAGAGRGRVRAAAGTEGGGDADPARRVSGWRGPDRAAPCPPGWVCRVQLVPKNSIPGRRKGREGKGRAGPLHLRVTSGSAYRADLCSAGLPHRGKGLKPGAWFIHFQCCQPA
jgi:hypothetical protein